MNEKDKTIDLGSTLVEYITHFADGSIWFHFTTLNGKIHGEYIYYNSVGRLRLHEYWENGNREGERIEYNER